LLAAEHGSRRDGGSKEGGMLRLLMKGGNESKRFEAESLAKLDCDIGRKFDLGENKEGETPRTVSL